MFSKCITDHQLTKQLLMVDDCHQCISSPFFPSSSSLYRSAIMSSPSSKSDSDNCGDARVVRSLDPCSNGPRFETTFRPVTKCEERIRQLSVIPGKKAKGITRCGHIERKDQGCIARLVYLFSGPLML